MVLWGQISVDKTKLEQIITWPNFTFGQLFLWIGANNDQIWLPMGWMSVSEKCSNRLKFDLIKLLVNFSCGLGPIMTRYDFLSSYGLDEWFWAMFEPNWICPNFTFGNFFMWIGANNDHIWLPYGLDEWFRAMFELTCTLPNFTFG